VSFRPQPEPTPLCRFSVPLLLKPLHQPHNLVDITRAGDPNVRRLLAVHSLPWRGMNRRLIVQFDPDEPSMSAPTFAEPDQGPLAGGRKVNARHDLTLGLWRRDCEISRGFPRR